MTQWAERPLSREQIVLFSPTLDSSIDEDHPVRLFDEILRALDWSAWEGNYCSNVGQPAIHPRIVASTILYGMSHGIRSSRRLEWACKNALDFIWLAEGHQMDHSTFCNFRSRFRGELKGVFRQLGCIARAMGMVRLNQIALDGTKVRANSNRKGATADSLRSEMASLDEQIEKWFAQADAVDRENGVLFEDTASATVLPNELSRLQKRRSLLSQALEAAKRTDAVRQRRSDRTSAPAAVPVADPESQIMPNKDGGYAPNYTPVVAVDGKCGYIAGTEVISGNDEAGLAAALVDGIERDFGTTPEAVLADALFGAGPTLQQLEDRRIEAYIPASTGPSPSNNPALRDDLSKPVAREDWARLPRNPQSKKLDRSAFVYCAKEDCYYCPMGRKIRRSYREQRYGLTVTRYECGHCFRCELSHLCLIGRSRYRTVTRDQYQDLRERATARMRTEEGRRNHARRMWLAEGTFGFIKACLGLRQFLCRGIEKVGTEWLWACTAFNIKKIAKEILSIRTKVQTPIL